MGLLFLLKLHGAHSADSLFPLNPLLLSGLQDLLILDPEFPALNIKTIQGSDDSIGIRWLAEICESQTTE